MKSSILSPLASRELIVVTGKDRKHKHWMTPVPMKKAAKKKGARR